ncbi:epoxide hydrolase N-terminal domain-containing protein [Nocardia sp. NPDC051463]|uniref:epoxide hydrolase N-terminal domain-containing protein n=1 Tax=Nocardia sp. NPDC051463 TaxID=3154845 RepID=UPI00344F96D1
MTAIRPFTIDIPQSRLNDLANRLQRTIWPNELRGVADSYGVPNGRVRALAEYWLDSFDWRALEAKLNSYPQFVTDT